MLSNIPLISQTKMFIQDEEIIAPNAKLHEQINALN
jgi:hypothetical protein